MRYYVGVITYVTWVARRIEPPLIAEHNIALTNKELKLAIGVHFIVHFHNRENRQNNVYFLNPGVVWL